MGVQVINELGMLGIVFLRLRVRSLVWTCWIRLRSSFRTTSCPNNRNINWKVGVEAEVDTSVALSKKLCAPWQAGLVEKSRTSHSAVIRHIRRLPSSMQHNGTHSASAQR